MEGKLTHTISTSGYISDMKMDVDDEGTKSSEESLNIRSSDKLTGDNTPETFEQNSNTSQHNSYDRNGNDE